MTYDRYTIQSSKSHLEHRFISHGPKGQVEKFVEFRELVKHSGLYNLSFGDLIDGLINDTIVTGNADGKKVLATVSSTVVEFFKIYPTASVFISGSTAARTRLYRMAISNNLEMLQQEFVLLGLNDSGLHEFERTVDYDAFIVRKKKI